MKFTVMALVLVLFSCYHCLFPTHALAQDNTPPKKCGASDTNCRSQASASMDASQDATIKWLMGQVSALERKVKAARAGVSREEVRDLRRQVKELADKVKALSDDLEAHKASSPTVAPPSSSEEFSPWALVLEGKVKDLQDRVGDLEAKVSALEGRVGAVERQLLRRAIRFDAGGFGLLSRGYIAVGGLGAIIWPLGQDGDWAVRTGVGAGQGWDWAEDRLHSVAWVTKADLLYRWESAALGLTGTLIGGAVRDGNRYLSWDGGVTARLTPVSWLFVQSSVVTGVAMGTTATLQPAMGGMLEVGVPFP